MPRKNSRPAARKERQRLKEQMNTKTKKPRHMGMIDTGRPALAFTALAAAAAFARNIKKD